MDSVSYLNLPDLMVLDGVGPRIGRGSSGQIFQCLDMNTLENYAIKVFKRGPGHCKAALHETKVLLKLRSWDQSSRYITTQPDT
jgi:serine/threonine protein kinase